MNWASTAWDSKAWQRRPVVITAGPITLHQTISTSLDALLLLPGPRPTLKVRNAIKTVRDYSAVKAATP